MKFLLQAFSKPFFRGRKIIVSAQLIKASPNSGVKDNSLHAPYLLLTCMDFRLRDDVRKFMEVRAGKNSYDEIVLPGASLAVLNDKYPHWGQTFEDVLRLAIELHGITTVIMMDHRECGAYKLFKAAGNFDTPEKETRVHKEVLLQVKAYLQKNYPHIKVETLLMDMNGTVETIQ